MRNKLHIAIVVTLSLVWLILPQALSWGATYYLDADPGIGNDNNPGTTPDAPWQTMDKVRTATQPGDTVIILNVHEETFAANWPDGITYKASGVTQFGITWTFDQNYTIGRFVNGDFWVVPNEVGGNVIIEQIFPSSFVGNGVRTQDGDTWVVAEGRTVNGAMRNPDPIVSQQGYDNASTSIIYDETLNVARKDGAPISSGKPLELPANNSLISSISLDHNHSEYATSQGYIVKSAAVLTILDNPAPEGSFRPPYCGSDKTIKFNENQLNYHLLKNLDKKDFCDSSDLNKAERMVDRPWIDHVGGCFGEVVAPIENMHRYPGYRNRQLQAIAMYLDVDWSGSPDFVSNNQYKRNLVVSTVQLGIDLYGIYQGGAKDHWVANGGHGVSRKWPILFAGVMLDGEEAHPDATAMANIGFNDYGDPHFGEDDQTFYVSQKNLDAQNATYGSGDSERGWADPGSIPYNANDPESGKGGVCEFARDGAISPCLNNCGPDSRDQFDIPYTQEDVDNKLPEFAIWGTDQYIYRCNRAWQTAYRRGQTAAGWAGLALSLHVMGLKEKWNHPAFFDYMDRYIAIEKQIKAKIVEAYQQKVKENSSLRLIEGYSRGYIWDPVNYITVPVEYNMPDTPEPDVHGNIVKEKFHYYWISSSDFVVKMWDTYRADYGPIWTPVKESELDELENELEDKIEVKCYNNVFNPTKGEEALIWIELQKQAHIKISLYNTRGNKIRQLADEEKDADVYQYYWDGKDDSGNVVGSGLYFVHIQAGDYKKTKKIIVVK